MNVAITRRTASLPKMVGYSLGQCANSLVMNGINGFALLYYTKALHLAPELAGMAMAASVFWEAITEPVMGHFSDHTRNRFGRRHPWMLLGGLLMAMCFYFVWAVPAAIQGNETTLFWYLVVMNLFLRSGLTMFFVPYLALGFEMCSDYEGRSKLQAVRQVLDMAANFAGPALAWTIFYKDSVGANGTVIKGTNDPANFLHMGTAFAIATALFVLLVLWFTREWIEDTRTTGKPQNKVTNENFFRDVRATLTDPNPRWVFVFIYLVCIGMVIVSSLQMFVYVDFMKFSDHEKSLTHGSTMIGMALGAAMSAWLAKKLDKKGAVILGGLVSIFCNGVLAALFLTGWVDVETNSALILFVIFHASYWLGNGIMLPIATSMMADVAELNRLRTGVNKDGAYSAMFSLAMRMAISFSFLLCGWLLKGVGFSTAENAVQTPQTIWNLGAATFIVGPLVCVGSLVAIYLYPITREKLKVTQGTA